MADAPEQENELKRALNRRRKVVDAKGAKFVKEATAQETDVTWQDLHEGQFTPRGRHRRAESDAVEDDATVVQVESSSRDNSQKTRVAVSKAKPSAKSRLSQFVPTSVPSSVPAASTNSLSTTSTTVAGETSEVTTDTGSVQQATVLVASDLETSSHMHLSDLDATSPVVPTMDVASQLRIPAPTTQVPSELDFRAPVVPTVDVASPSRLPVSTGHVPNELDFTCPVVPKRDVASPSRLPVSAAQAPGDLDATSPLVPKFDVGSLRTLPSSSAQAESAVVTPAPSMGVGRADEVSVPTLENPRSPQRQGPVAIAAGIMAAASASSPASKVVTGQIRSPISQSLPSAQLSPGSVANMPAVATTVSTTEVVAGQPRSRLPNFQLPSAQLSAGSVANMAAVATTGSSIEVSQKSLADTRKAQLLLPRELDGKVPPLGELPASGTQPGKPVAARILGGGIAAMAKSENKGNSPISSAFVASSNSAQGKVLADPAPSLTGSVKELAPKIAMSNTGTPGVQRMYSTPVLNTPVATPVATAPGGGVQRMVSAPVRQECSDQRVWHAVVEGNVRALEDLAAQGVLRSGKLTDHNGHSILWNAVAFQQAHVACWLLQRFPPESPVGVDLSEVHARRGDSLLHLCLYFSDFHAAVAEVFKHAFKSQAPRSKLNHNGQSFLSIAAARMNFWVMHFALTNAPDSVPLLVQADHSGNSPLAILRKRVLEVVGVPVKPDLQAPLEQVMQPAWCALGKHKPSVITAEGKGPPFADLILEVEDDTCSNGVARIAAHRVVVSACSGVMDSLVRKSDASTVRVDPLCCRNAKVLLAMLTFCYSGEITFSSWDDAFLVWQLFCLCKQYALPDVLTSYVRILLVRSLGDAKHAPVSSVLLQAADKLSLTPSEAYVAAHAFLVDPRAALSSIEGDEQKAQVVGIALTHIEQYYTNSQSISSARFQQMPPRDAAAIQDTAALDAYSQGGQYARSSVQDAAALDAFNQGGRHSLRFSGLTPSPSSVFLQPPPTPALGTRDI